MKTFYKDVVGVRLTSTCKDESGTVIDLTSKTATLKIYAFGTNNLKASHAMTNLVAAAGTCYYDIAASDFDTIGDFYTTVIITGTGYSYVMVDESYRIISNQDNIVTTNELLRFMDIPTESARPPDVLKDYLEQGEAQLDLDVPSLLASTNPSYIKLKQHLIKLCAGRLYFMNMDEGNISPTARLQKIEAWQKEYNETSNKLNSVLSDTSDSNGIVRRVPSSNYFGANPLTQAYSPGGMTTIPVSGTTTTTSITLTGYAVGMEAYAGSACSGSDGALARELTLANTKALSSTGLIVFRNGSQITLTDYTNNTGIHAVIAFTNVNIFNADTITVVYFTSAT